MKLINKPKLYDSYSTTLAPSWGQIELGSRDIIRNLRNIDFNKLVVVVRGGMVLSIIISHHFGVKEMAFFHASRNSSDLPHSYSTLKIHKHAEVKKGDKVLIVEDIVYQGRSINAAIKNVLDAKATVAAVCSLFMDENFGTEYLKKLGTYRMKYISSYRCKNLKWIRFPWENKIAGEEIGQIK